MYCLKYNEQRLLLLAVLINLHIDGGGLDRVVANIEKHTLYDYRKRLTPRS